MSSLGRPRGFDRDAAVDAAVLLFWEYGYEAASLLMLREAMGGISAASFYAAFESKEALFAEALVRYGQRHGGAAAKLATAALPPRASLEQVLRRAVQTDPAGRTPRGDLVVLAALVGPAESATVRERLAAERRRLRAGLLGCVARAVAAGELPSGTDAAALAAAFEAILFGLSVQARDGVDPAILDRAVTLALALWDARAGSG